MVVTVTSIVATVWSKVVTATSMVEVELMALVPNDP